MPHIVALVPLDTYDQPRVDSALQTGLDLLGGIHRFVSPEEKILIKPNLVCAATPDKAATTHPAVFSALCRALREAGCSALSYGDSPGSPTVTPEKAADVAGIKAVAEQYGVALADFVSGSIVPFPAGHTAKSFYLCNGVQAADALISVGKMKAHALQRITGAMKNVYGCVTGINKTAGHANFPNAEVFAEMVADLQRCLRPRLHILDGVVAMEGNGPTAGTPKAMHVLLLSDDPVALDAVFAALVYLPPALVPTCVAGAAAGLGTMALDELEVRTPAGSVTVAEVQAQYGRADFDVFRDPALKGGLLTKLKPLQPLLSHRPVVDRQKCVGCGVCERVCPAEGKAVRAGRGEKARYDYQRCIRCYCCQEMCPQKAISVHRSLLNRLLSGR